MKKTFVALSFAISLLIVACGGSNTGDTTTDMPDSGYEPRTGNTTNSTPVTTDALPRGAVGVDSINNGHTNTAGVPDSANNTQDSSGRR